MMKFSLANTVYKKIALLVVLFICFIGALGSAYQYFSERHDRLQYHPPGQMIDVGGFNLHLYGMGQTGPVVIMEAGIGGSCLTWYSIQKKLSAIAQVYTYDRAGYGWSDPSPSPRTALHIVQELHSLLKNAKITGPYIFVGHSFGGVIVRLYANTYPDDVAGVILIDASHENMPITHGTYWSYLVPKLEAFFGLMRLRDSEASDPLRDIHTPEINKILQAQSLYTHTVWTLLDEDSLYSESLRNLKNSPNHLKNKPLTVITAGLNRDPNSTELRFIPQSESWLILQKDLAKKSTKGRLIIAKNSHHMIMVTEPDVIISAITEMIHEYQDQQDPTHHRHK